MNARSLLAVCALVIACDDATRPVEPVWGKQACSHCAMLLSDPRFGAELTTEAGERYFFDDPGCMAAFVRDRSPRVRAMWVHQGSTWIDAKSARFERAASPMDYGFAASKNGTATWADVEAAATKRSGGES